MDQPDGDTDRRGHVSTSLSLFPSLLIHLLPHSKLPYDVSNDQALEHEEVRTRVQETIKTLSSLATRFQQSIFDNIDKIP